MLKAVFQVNSVLTVLVLKLISRPGDWSWDDVRGRMLYCKLRKVDFGTVSVNHQV